MFNNVDALVNKDETRTALYDTFCPLFSSEDKAIDYAISTVNEICRFHPSPVVLHDKYGNILIEGDTWTMAVIPLTIGDEKYYEVAKVSLRDGRYVIPEGGYYRAPIIDMLNPYQNKPLSASDVKRIERIVVGTDGIFYKDGKIINQWRSFSFPGRPYYRMMVNIRMHDVLSHCAAHIVWAVLMGETYDTIKLLTSHVATYCPEYLTSNDIDQLNIIELRNRGWQWSIDHINNNPSDNNICNLQLMTLQGNNKLRDIRRNISQKNIIL